MWDSIEYVEQGCDKMPARAPKHVESLEAVCSMLFPSSEAQACIMKTHLCQLTLHTCVMRKSSRDNQVKMEVFWDPDFGCVSGEWTGFHFEVSGFFPVPLH